MGDRLNFLVDAGSPQTMIHGSFHRPGRLGHLPRPVASSSPFNDPLVPAPTSSAIGANRYGAVDCGVSRWHGICGDAPSIRYSARFHRLFPWSGCSMRMAAKCRQRVEAWIVRSWQRLRRCNPWIYGPERFWCRLSCRFWCRFWGRLLFHSWQLFHARRCFSLFRLY